MLDQQSMRFLEELCNSFGPSGFEQEPARMVRDYVSRYADDITSDKMGSLLFKKRGTASHPVVLLPGHVDEVGVIVSSINKQGFLTFNQLGEWFDQVLLGQRFKIRTEKGPVLGIIVSKPPHLLQASERDKVVTSEKMFIDIGASNEEEAREMGVKVGNPAVPDSGFSSMRKTLYDGGKKKGSDTILIGKAFDNRVCAFIAAEVLRDLVEKKTEHPNTVVGAATTQEEVGFRGATTAAFVSKPDVSITLDVDISGDVPGIEPREAPSKMGFGPSITTYDDTMIPNQELVELVIKTAEKSKIPYQLAQTTEGGTDAAVIHISRSGCPTVVIGPPTRHIHSHVGMCSLRDIQDSVRLVVEVLKKLDKKTVDGLTEF